MEKRSVELTKNPKNVTVIEGFPGFGLVANIATGFLIEHLKCEQIGNYYFEKVTPTLAVHNCEVIYPVGIFYNSKHNLIIINSITPPVGIEWQAADLVLDICRQVNAKELISVEGVGSSEGIGAKAFYYCNDKKCEARMQKLGVNCLGEGIIVGVTSALFLKSNITTTCVFASTQSNLPDSKAAAKVIEVLDRYLGLNVDYKPLLKQAEEFETKIRSLLEQSMKAQKVKEKKDMRYVG